MALTLIQLISEQTMQNVLQAEMILAAHGLFPGRDYYFTKDKNAISQFGEAAYRLYQDRPQMLRQFRSAWRQFCTEGRNKPSIADVRRIESKEIKEIPMAKELALAEFLDYAVRCGFLERRANRLQVNFAGANSMMQKRYRLEHVSNRTEAVNKMVQPPGSGL